ncbi:MAG TPA: acyl-CoA reductase [Chthoniobacterales bacterium]|jgi:Acyl-CoA reductase (LuxC)|nr:acyl-CoA reductase [Chthoniobacterales bacterium]
MRLDERIAAIVAAAATVSGLVDLTLENISHWIELELGQYLSDPKPQPYGNQHCQIYPLSPILHIVSGNTPHAALQSLIRGVIVGATNWIKLPRQGIPELEFFVGALPKQLRPEMAPELLSNWMEEAEVIVVFGSDETVREFSQRVLPSQRLLAHGQKVSLGLIWGRCDPQIAEGIARDVFPFDQLGCLSPQFFYVAGDSAEFALQLSHHLEKQLPGALAPARNRETAGALRAFREEWKFRAATESGVLMRESSGNLDWVVIHDPESRLVPNPLHGTILIKPMPRDAELVLAPIRRLISTIGLFPIDQESVHFGVRLGAQRICRIGQMQHPPLTWHHDGWPALGSFVRFVDIEGLSG